MSEFTIVMIAVVCVAAFVAGYRLGRHREWRRWMAAAMALKEADDE